MIAGLTISESLMFFCFDVMDGQDKTVALTCPKIPFKKDITIAKCCPPGQKVETDFLGTSGKCAQPTREETWQISINGHLYNSSELFEQKILVYDNRSKVQFFERK